MQTVLSNIKGTLKMHDIKMQDWSKREKVLNAVDLRQVTLWRSEGDFQVKSMTVDSILFNMEYTAIPKRRRFFCAHENEL